MSSQRKTAIVTGASQGIGAGIVQAFVERGFNVVANSRKVSQSTEVAASHDVALVDGDIGEAATAARIVETALSRFQSIEIRPFHFKVPEAALVDIWRRVDGKTSTPNLTCERIEHDERREFHTFRKRAGHQCRSNDGEHELIKHERLMRDRRGVVRIRRQSDAA